MHRPVPEPKDDRRRILIGLRGLRGRGRTAQQPQMALEHLGERHSTPLRSATGKLWSPAFHLAEEAPVQNHRKDTDLPSKDAFPSYALNCNGPSGGLTR